MTTPTFDTDLAGLTDDLLRALHREDVGREVLAGRPQVSPGQVALVLRALADFSHNARMVAGATKLADDPAVGLSRYLTDLAGHLGRHGTGEVYDPRYWLFHRPVTDRVVQRLATIDASDLGTAEERPTPQQAAAVVLALAGAPARHIASGPDGPAWLLAARVGLVLHQLADRVVHTVAAQEGGR